MRVPSPILLLFSASFPPKHLPYRYRVYIAEAKKRLIYVGLSLLLAFLCAYTERVALMYLIASPLQKALAKEGQIEIAQWENTISLQLQQSGTALFSPHSRTNEFANAATNGGVQLIFTDVEEAFYTLLSISLFWCLLASLPVLIYHVWCFIQPGVGAWQSQRVRSFLYRSVLCIYLVLYLVDQYLLPRLLSFFYGFEIERASLCLHAEIKVVSYVSSYLFVNSITLALCIIGVAYRLYTEKQILYSLDLSYPSTENFCQSEPSRKQLAKTGGYSFRYQAQRSKLWWGCLLVSAILCPPEISSQLSCALLLILLSEVSICLAYISSCRFKYQTHAKEPVLTKPLSSIKCALIILLCPLHVL